MHARRPGSDRFAVLAMTNQRFRMRPIDPTGKSPKVYRVPLAKIFRLTRRANQRYQLAPSHPMRGALRNVTNARWDAVDAKGATDGEVVWSWRPGAGAKFRGTGPDEVTVARKPVTGESTK